MDSIPNRAHAIIYALGLSLGIALFGNYLTGQYQLKNANIPINITDVKVVGFGIGQYKNEDAVIELKLQYDFNEIFNWSTNSIYFFIVADYETLSHPLNEIIIHDEILTDPDQAIKDERIICKYFLADYARSMRNRDVTLRAYYWFFPIGGAFIKRQIFQTTLKMPINYSI